MDACLLRAYWQDSLGRPERLFRDAVEDRRLKLAGYQVFRFGGSELGPPGAEAMLNELFDEVHSRMS